MDRDEMLRLLRRNDLSEEYREFLEEELEGEMRGDTGDTLY